jgi:hypothetical protein
LALDSVENDKTVFDIFVMETTKLDLATISQAANLTGGTTYFYNYQNNNDMKYFSFST